MTPPLSGSRSDPSSHKRRGLLSRGEAFLAVPLLSIKSGFDRGFHRSLFDRQSRSTFPLARVLTFQKCFSDASSRAALLARAATGPEHILRRASVLREGREPTDVTALIAAPHLAFRAAPFAKRSRAPRVSAERPHSSKAPRVVTVMAASKAARGAFILFEGVDRCGKTTQSTRLVETLKASGVDAELWRYPDRTTGMGQMINAYLQSKTEMDDGAIHLLFSANRWEKRAAMEEKLSSGVTLVVDRYSYSGVAFTAAKGVPGLDLEWCKAPERGLLRPDAVLYLNMPIEAAQKRGGFGEERYETSDLQKAVRANFEQLTEDWWTIVDATGTVEEVAEECERVAKDAVDRCKTGLEFTRLWQ